MSTSGSDECKVRASTCPCCNPCPKDTFKVEILSVSSDKTLPSSNPASRTPLKEIRPGEPFAIQVTPYVDNVMAVVESCTGTTLTLNDATEFQAKGEGVIATECVPICFAWTGKSGNTLTGVSPTLSGVVKGMKVRCQTHKTLWDNYPGTSPLEVQAWTYRTAGEQTTREEVPLDGTWMNYCWWNYWKNAPWVFETNQVLENPYDADVDIWIMVTERSTPSTGRTGAVKVKLCRNPHSLRVIPLTYHVASAGTSFQLKVEGCFQNSDCADAFYKPASAVNLQVSSGSIYPTQIQISEWTNGCAVRSCQISGTTGAVTITAKEGTSGPSGTAEVCVGGTAHECEGAERGALWQPGYDQYEKSPCSWNDVQYFVYDQFKTQSSWGDNLPTSMQFVATYGGTDYIYFFAGNMTGGYVTFHVDSEKVSPGNVKACYLLCPAGACIYRGSGMSPEYRWSPYAHWYDFKVKLLSSADYTPGAGTGATLRTGVQSADASGTYAKINAHLIAQNAQLQTVVQGASTVALPVSKTTVQGLLSKSYTIHALFFTEGRNVPFKVDHFNAGGSVYDQPYHIAFIGCAGDPVPPKLVIITEES